MGVRTREIVDSLISSGNFLAAENHLKPLLENGDIEAQNLQALVKIFSNNLNEAESILLTILNVNPNEGEALNNLDYVRNLKKMYSFCEESIKSIFRLTHVKCSYISECESIKQALDIDNTNEDYILILALLELFNANYDFVLSIINYFEENQSQYLNIIKRLYLNRDSFNRNNKNLTEFYNTFSVISADWMANGIQNRVYNLYRYAISYYENEQYQRVIDNINKALELNCSVTYFGVSNYNLLLLKALAQIKLGNYSEFIVNVINGLISHPLFEDILTEADNIDDLISRNRYVSITETFKGKEDSLDEKNTNSLALSYTLLGDYSNAKSVLNNYFLMNKNSTLTIENLFNLLYLTCDYKEIECIIQNNKHLLSFPRIKNTYEKIQSISSDYQKIKIVCREEREVPNYKFLTSYQNSGTLWLRDILSTILQKYAYEGKVFNELLHSSVDKLNKTFSTNGTDLLYYDHMLYNEHYARLVMNDIKTVILYRHPYECFVSDIRYRIRLKNDPRSLDEIAYEMIKKPRFKDEYRHNIKQWLFLWLEKGDVYAVQYENLLKYPKITIQNICNYLNIKYSDKLINYSLLVNNCYAKTSTEIGVFPSCLSDGRGNFGGEWKNILNSEIKEALNSFIGDIVIKLGYDIE